MTQYEILTTAAVSGSVRERLYNTSARQNVWVRFDAEEGEPWMGVFGVGGVSPFSAVVPFTSDDGRTVLVIAGGQGYIVDAITGDLLRQTSWDYSYSAASVPGRDFVLVADTTSIWASDRAGDVYAVRSDRVRYDPDATLDAHRVALDGIVFDEPGPDVLTGKVWEPDGWYAFRLRYDGMRFERGARLADRHDAFEAIRGRGGFPGSKAYHAWLKQFQL